MLTVIIKDKNHKADYLTISWRVILAHTVDKTEKIRSRLK